MAMNNRRIARNKAVPFFVLHLADARFKALFTVPSGMAETLILHPILCRGGSFDLTIDLVSQNDSMQSTSTSFLSTEFSSSYPEETARAIAERIAIRQEDPSPAVSHLFGR